MELSVFTPSPSTLVPIVVPTSTLRQRRQPPPLDLAAAIDRVLAQTTGQRNRTALQELKFVVLRARQQSKGAAR